MLTSNLNLKMQDARRFLVAGNWKMNGSKSLLNTIVTALNVATFNSSVGTFIIIIIIQQQYYT